MSAVATSITPDEFELLCAFLRQDSAIVLEAGKEYLVESRLAPVARRLGVESVGELVRQAHRAPRSTMRTEVIDAMTTNETSFFRDVHPWETLRTVLLPRLLEARRTTRQLSIWCGACSSGQEPYTLAMMLRESFPELDHGWRVSIVATDLSEAMLHRSREAIYSQLEVNRGLPAPMLLRWFERDRTSWKLKDEIRSMVKVQSSNLVVPTTWPTSTPFDLVLMRNVLIYFDDATKRSIVANAAERMRPDAVLFLGSSEVSTHDATRLAREQADRTVYFRRLA